MKYENKTVDFDAQDDSFMAKILVSAGTQDIPVGTPIFVTVDDADSVPAFKDFTVAAEAPAAAPAVAEAEKPAPVVEKPPPPPPPPAAPTAAVALVAAPVAPSLEPAAPAAVTPASVGSVMSGKCLG